MREADFFRITSVEETDSTNTQLKRLAAAGEKEGAVLIARRQTEGRGRLGRRFHSPNGTGLYMSVLLRPDLSPEDMPLLTTAAAVACCRAIDSETDKTPAIKWVNDILWQERKVAGILAEGRPGDYAVIGLGLNLAEPAEGFPPDIQHIAGALYGREPVTEQQKSGLAVRFLEEFLPLYRELPDTDFLREYRARCTTLGRRVLVHAATCYEAEAVDVDARGALILRLDTGKTAVLNAGEVSVRPLP